MIDSYGREILSERFDGGIRYFSPDGSINMALKTPNDNQALLVFNENPPKTHKDVENEATNTILDSLESLSPSQLKRFKKILLSAK